MAVTQHIFRVRRNYNQWVANQTLEDYALRFTAKEARRWTGARVATTALGAISFLALEAIGATITLHYGFNNAVVAVLIVSAIIFLSSIPISYYAAKYGVDIDLLTRGAGFGYIGSTVTSLIYASFTFIFFAIEAAIMATALQMLFGLPLALGYLLSSIAIIPMVTHGITFISRFQLWSQPIWIALQLLPFIVIIYTDASAVKDWTEFAGVQPEQTKNISLMYVGAASAVVFSLIAQIGEQVDFLRFMPPPKPQQEWRWWCAILAGGPGWIVIGAIKILAGSFLAVLALRFEIPFENASEPARLYQVAFGYLTHSPQVAIAVAGIFVILSQLKINVTNAYAGSIAWSNFFSRLTHSHPGRVVWLVFNVVIALLLMELGVYHALEQTLSFYAIVAVAWLGSLVADLVINKPLGLSPKHIEFKRAYLYDINPVGFGSMIISTVVGILCLAGFLGQIAQELSHFITLATALICAPFIAWQTKGKYYLSRPRDEFLIFSSKSTTKISTHTLDINLLTCCICEHRFEIEDMAHCPAYAGPICSLCCSLDARCNDHCKPEASYREQIQHFLGKILPERFTRQVNSHLGQFLSLILIINCLSGLFLSLIYFQTNIHDNEIAKLLEDTLWKAFFLLVIITGVVSWLFVLAHESRYVAQEESQRQTRLLLEEIEAHERTDKALQLAKEQAEAANQAKSKYLTGISHELRSPLNAVLGYAQLLEKDPKIPENRRDALGVIRRSGEHLADLIEGLLDISKIEAGRFELQSGEVNLPILMDQLVNMFRLQAEAKGLQFIYQCNDKLPELVKCDEKRVRQILINLLSNAIKYTKKGSIFLKLRYRNQVAEFTIKDTGEGIAPENFDRIFRPFERIRGPGSSTSGTGLGLTITRLLTEIMGGEITVKSQLGEGSLFTVSLMLSSISKARIETSPKPAQTIRGYLGSPKTILVVDDDETHQNLIKNLLMPLGFNLISITNPLEIQNYMLRCAEEKKLPDLLLLDVSMPAMDGWSVARWVREAKFNLPIIMVSADASEGRDQPPMETPLHNAYITKPIRLQLLLDHISHFLDVDWQYFEQNQTLSTTTKSSPHDFPTEKHLEDIVHLAQIGHKRGLLEKINNLEAEQSASKEFIQHLKTLTAQFQFEKIVSWIDAAYIEDLD